MNGGTNAQDKTGQICLANIVVGQTISAGWTATILNFSSFTGDNKYFQNVSNNTVKILKKGNYLVNFTLGISGGMGKQFLSMISVNTITRCITRHVLTENDEEWNVSIILPLDVNDSVQFVMNSPQTTGSTQAWSQFQIAHLGGGRKLISRILSFFGRCRR